MKARTHDIAAITALLGVVVVQPTPPTVTLATAIAIILANQMGGIAPDIDQPTAPFWRNLPIGGIVGRMIGKMLGGHRFITHSLLGMVLVGFLIHWILTFFQPLFPNVQTNYVWWAFMIGMASHLIMDTFTKEGVPWLLPVPIKFGIPPFKRFRITTGKWGETYIVLPVLIVIIAGICSAHYGQLVTLIHQHITR